MPFTFVKQAGLFLTLVCGGLFALTFRLCLISDSVWAQSLLSSDDREVVTCYELLATSHLDLDGLASRWHLDLPVFTTWTMW